MARRLRQSIRPVMPHSSAATNSFSSILRESLACLGNTMACAIRSFRYRLAIMKNVHQVSLEAGNSPQHGIRALPADWSVKAKRRNGSPLCQLRRPAQVRIIPMPATSSVPTGTDTAKKLVSPVAAKLHSRYWLNASNISPILPSARVTPSQTKGSVSANKSR